MQQEENTRNSFKSLKNYHEGKKQDLSHDSSNTNIFSPMLKEAPQPSMTYDKGVPLWYAIQQGKWSLFEESLKQNFYNDSKCPVAEVDPDYLASPLHWAAINQRPGMTARLLQLGADPNSFSGINHTNNSTAHQQILGDSETAAAHGTPLHWSVITGNTFISQLLVNYHADITLMDSKGFSLLIIAVQHLHWFYVHWLLALFLNFQDHSRIESSFVDSDGHSIYHWAIFRQFSSWEFNLMRHLINAHIQSNNHPSQFIQDIQYCRHRDKHGRTALHWAVDLGNIDLIILILESTPYKDDLHFLLDTAGDSPAAIAMRKKYSWFPWVFAFLNLKKVAL